MRLHRVLALLAGLMCAHALTAAAQTFPTKPLRIVVPFAPGGPADASARRLAQALTPRLGQQVIIENRAGGGGVIAANAVLGSAPDGYTLLFGAVSGLAFTGKINPTITYDPLGDFTPISLTHVVPLFFIVHADTPASSLSEFIAYAKARPRQLTFGSAGNGTSSHLCLEALKSAAGIDMTHVPYRGSSLAMADLLAKRIDIMCDPYQAHRAHVEAGTLRVLAVASARPSEVLPSAPPASGAGLPGFDISTWFALMAPRGTPLEVRNRIAADIAAVQKSDEMRAWGRSLGLEAVSSTPDELTAFLKAEAAKWEKIVTDARVDLK
ncbi:MAG: Bug family tripartite tricarboxylate transporter substrate binding protein [Burkholderiaceae bacterium]